MCAARRSCISAIWACASCRGSRGTSSVRSTLPGYPAGDLGREEASTKRAYESEGNGTAREREVLTYRFLLNRSVREIAAMLLLTEDAVKALVYRALQLAADLDRNMA